jgi:chitin disaccharide deacetylase
VKRLIVTADDVGLDAGMTAGAIEAHRHGIVTACSIVANGVAFDDAVARLREVPSLEIGVHLALVEERALTTGERMPRDYLRFVLECGGHAAPVARRHGRRTPELRAQIERVLATGLRVTHLNGHQHLHVLPSIFAIVTRLAEEYRIPYIRTVHDFGGHVPITRRLAIHVLNRLGTNARRTIGVANAGHLDVPLLLELLDYVDDCTELVTHPGLGVRAYAHWRYAWERETRALCDPRLREAIAAKGIALIAPSEARA